MKIFTSSPTTFENAQAEALAAGWTKEELSKAGYASEWIKGYASIHTISLPETQEERYELFSAQYQNSF